MRSNLPPHDLEAEASVLGSILLDNRAFDDVREILTSEKIFYKESHRTIYKHMTDLMNASIPVDYLTLQDRLSNANQLEAIGGIAYLVGLAESVPTSVYADHYARIVVRHAHLRDLETFGRKLQQLAREADPDLSPLELHARAHEFLAEALPNSSRTGSVRAISSWLEEVHLDMNRQAEEANPDAITTGFDDLDGMVNPLEPGTLNVLAARPSMGKSAAMLQIALQAAEQGKGVLIVSLEMRGKALLKRAMCVLGKVDSSRITQRSLTGPDRARLERAGQELMGLPLFVLDHSSATVESLRAVLREQNRKHPIRFCAVDYLQLMDAIKSKNSSRQEEVAAISRGLLALAREFEIPLLVLSQLSRACELRHNKRPILSDLRESGQIEQDSNLVMALYRDEYYDPNSTKKGIAEVIVLKQREGPVGTVELQWHPNHVAFRDLARCV